MDSSAPNPQQTGLQLADTRALPHKEVLESLKDEEDRDIFAWLRLARSLPSTSKCSSNLARLTSTQLRAIAILKHCNTDDVSALLRRVRTSSANQTFAVSASHPIHDQAPDQELEGSSIFSDASSLSLSVTSPHVGAHQQILTRGSAAQPSPAATVPLVKEEQKYYCTYCDFPNDFNILGCWRRHEWDHVSKYICMLNGATEDTPQGIKCAFCGELDPSEGHLSTHNVEICRPGSSGPFSCQTYDEMVDHLYKAHHVDNWRTLDRLVPKLKDTVNKQAWSCGFCVISLASFADRLSHIASHFEQGQTIHEWDTTKVIKGLLQQPGVIKAWEEKVASMETGEIDCRYWMKDATKALRRDLEVGPNPKKTAWDLANAAIAASELNLQKWLLESTDPDAFNFHEDDWF